MPNSHIHN